MEIEIEFRTRAALREFERRFVAVQDYMPSPFAPMRYAFAGDRADTAENLINEIGGAVVLRREE